MQDSATSSNPIISFEDVITIFSNIENIFNINSTVLEELEVKMANWSSSQTLGDLFLKIVSNRYIGNTISVTTNSKKPLKNQNFVILLSVTQWASL